MGKYSVPESIRKLKPKGTMAKNISGYFYVYEYKTVVGDNGKRKTRMGKVIGSIKPDVGFVPNNNYLCDEEISCLEFGEYAVTTGPFKGMFQSSRCPFNLCSLNHPFCTGFHLYERYTELL